MADNHPHLAGEIALIQQMARPGYLEESEELSKLPTEALIQILGPKVQHALLREVSGEQADAKIDEIAGTAAKAIPILQRMFAITKNIGLSNVIFERLTREAIREDIQPTPDEIQQHTRELAHCMLSNWLSLLSDAVEEARDHVVKLNDSGLPTTIDPDEFLEGLDFYALSERELLDSLLELHAQLRLHKTSKVTPDLYFYPGRLGSLIGLDLARIHRRARGAEREAAARRQIRVSEAIYAKAIEYQEVVRPIIEDLMSGNIPDEALLDPSDYELANRVSRESFDDLRRRPQVSMFVSARGRYALNFTAIVHAIFMSLREVLPETDSKLGFFSLLELLHRMRGFTPFVREWPIPDTLAHIEEEESRHFVRLARASSAAIFQFLAESDDFTESADLTPRILVRDPKEDIESGIASLLLLFRTGYQYENLRAELKSKLAMRINPTPGFF